jgi:hypothetical protein
LLLEGGIGKARWWWCEVGSGTTECNEVALKVAAN